MKKYNEITDGWFSVTPILSYSRYLNIITGRRSSGKSTGVAIFLLLDFLENGHHFLYTRRTEDETQLTAPAWFDNAAQILTDNGIQCIVKYEKGTYKVNDIEAGKAIPLSQQQKHKGSNLSLVYWIVYDEFLSFDGRYLGSKSDPLREYRFLMSLYQTCDRGIGTAYRNEVKIFCLGNSDTYYNPIYMSLGIDRLIRTDTHFLAPKNELWVVEQVRESDTPASKEYKQSVGYLLSDQRTKDYAYENLAVQETCDKAFIKRINKPMMSLYNFVYNGEKFGVYASYQDGYIYVSTVPNMGKTYALDLDDHRPNYLLARSNTPMIRQLKNCYIGGQIYFENMKLKYCIDNYLRFVV